MKEIGVDIEPKKKLPKKAEVIDLTSAPEPQEVVVKETSVIPVNKDDYILVRVGSKMKLCMAHMPKRGVAYVVETMHTDDPQTVEYASGIVANLGTKLPEGKAFGVDLFAYQTDIETKIGTIKSFRETSDTERKALRIAARKTLEILTERKLDHLVLPVTSMELYNAKGKYAGMYQVSFRDGKPTDKIKFFPKIITDIQYNIYVMCHELGHALWYKHVNEQKRADWLEAYDTMNKVSRVKKEQLADLYQRLLQSNMTVKEFAKDVDEDDAMTFREALFFLKKHHKLGIPEIDLLLNENSQMLHGIWPTSASVSRTETLMGDYATKSVQELFAEACAFTWTGKEIPKQFASLLKSSL